MTFLAQAKTIVKLYHLHKFYVASLPSLLKQYNTMHANARHWYEVLHTREALRFFFEVEHRPEDDTTGTAFDSRARARFASPMSPWYTWPGATDL